jgi:hypothetical protein
MVAASFVTLLLFYGRRPLCTAAFHIAKNNRAMAVVLGHGESMMVVVSSHVFRGHARCPAVILGTWLKA